MARAQLLITGYDFLYHSMIEVLSFAMVSQAEIHRNRTSPQACKDPIVFGGGGGTGKD